MCSHGVLMEITKVLKSFIRRGDPILLAMQRVCICIYIRAVAIEYFSNRVF